MKPMNFPDRKQQRREEAIERQEARDNRSDLEQFNLLCKRGYPDCKEADKLRARMQAKAEKEVSK